METYWGQGVTQKASVSWCLSLALATQAGFGFIIAFDADLLPLTYVNDAQRKLGNELKGIAIYTTGLWRIEDVQGMDDFILQNGYSAF